jgi:hypothetical protein
MADAERANKVRERAVLANVFVFGCGRYAKGHRLRSAPTRSQNSTVRWRRSPPPLRLCRASTLTPMLSIKTLLIRGAIDSVKDEPQRPQNFACGRLPNSHLGQRHSKATPHSMQNLVVSGFSKSQLGQRIPSPCRWRSTAFPSITNAARTVPHSRAQLLSTVIEDVDRNLFTQKVEPSVRNGI